MIDFGMPIGTPVLAARRGHTELHSVEKYARVHGQAAAAALARVGTTLRSGEVEAVSAVLMTHTAR